MELPILFEARMKAMLGDEYDSFRGALFRAPQRGLYANKIKLDAVGICKLAPFAISPSPFCADAFIIDDECAAAGLTPLFAAGGYYVQEPSAICAAQALSVKEGERVLDLCAAPGGKACRLAAAVKDKGLLVANEIVRARAKILASNLERCGARAVVTSLSPDRLAQALPCFFDKILVDAPCSGEGMFRKDEVALREWSEEHLRACALRQRKILESADRLLAPGGTLVYSTCTFSEEENEQTVGFLIQNFGYKLLPITEFPHSSGLPPYTDCARLFPHRQKGEGHFVAKLQKPAGEQPPEQKAAIRAEKIPRLDEFQALMRELFPAVDASGAYLSGDYFYLPPEGFPRSALPLSFAPGVQAAKCEKGRLEPCHHLFMAYGKGCKNTLSLDSDEARRFIAGEELACDKSGYTAVLFEGLTLGFGKASGGRLKNKYPKGLRVSLQQYK